MGMYVTSRIKINWNPARTFSTKFLLVFFFFFLFLAFFVKDLWVEDHSSAYIRTRLRIHAPQSIGCKFLQPLFLLDLIL